MNPPDPTNRNGNGNGDGNGDGHPQGPGPTASNSRDGNGVAAIAAHRPVSRSLPRPTVRRRRWPGLVVWLVPLGVAVGAAYYFHRLYLEIGPEVTITFADASGVKVGETPLTVHGVRVATVTAVDLAPDNVHARVHVRFQRGTGPIANTGTLFYMVRPDLAGGNVQGLGTIVSGPYITAIVGHGDPADTFDGREGAPVMRGAGIRVILHASRLDHVGVGAPVYYRGLQVGVIQDVRLSSDSTGVNVTAFIWLRYARLVRTSSQFWPLSSAEVKGGLLSGIQVNLGTLRTLLGGGLAFATPDERYGSLAQDGSQFELNVDGPRPEWLTWAPRINLGPDDLGPAETGDGAQRDQGVLQSLIRVR